jgi:hypothetical protein
MKRFFLILAIIIALPTALVAQDKTRHTEWRFISQNKGDATGADFLKDGRYAPTSGQNAWIRFESSNPIAKPNLTKRSEPICNNTREGDCWIFELQVDELAKGSIVDIWCPIHTYPTGVGHRFVVEYLNGKRWVPLMPLNKDGSNFRTSKTASCKYFWQSFRLQKAIKRGLISVRIRQIEAHIGASYVAGGNRYPQITIFPEVEVRDTTRILFIGNSYTYYNNYPYIFKEIAVSEGHYADCWMSEKGGWTMTKHMRYQPTIEAVEKDGYDYIFLQDQSYERIFSGTEDDFGSLKGMTDIAAWVRQHNPKAQPIIALTWGRKHGNNHLRKQDLPLIDKYPSFFASFEHMQARLNEVVAIEAKEIDAKIALQGPAWQIVRRERPDIELYIKDGSHPSYPGSYLAAAVSYLTIYGEPFGTNTANGMLDPETAQYLRSVAERVVLKGER